MITIGKLFFVSLLVGAAWQGTASAQNLIPVNVGAAAVATDAALYISQKKGFFREEGIEAKLTNFRSASDMVAPLGTGQLDAGAGSASAGLYNAMLQGIRIKIVADKASSAPGYSSVKIIVRKDLVDSGRYKSPVDFKGMKFAMNAPGVSNTAALNALLKSVGLKYTDVETVNMPLPDHVAAVANKAVDAAASVEPSGTIAIQRGYAVLVKPDDQIIPNHQTAVLLYSEAFAKKTDAANRFMRAYLKGIRYFNDALKDGHLAGPTADEVIAVLTEMTPIKDPAIYRAITPSGVNPDGHVNVQSLVDDAAFYKSQGLITGDIRVEDTVDMSFVDDALKVLGPYKKK